MPSHVNATWLEWKGEQNSDELKPSSTDILKIFDAGAGMVAQKAGPLPVGAGILYGHQF